MKTILIIEDDTRITQVLSIRLKAAGYASLIAHDVPAGTRLAIENKPDLILLDLALPGGNGWELVKLFRGLDETRDIPVVFLTASKDPELRKRAMEMNVAGLFEKPYDAAELLSVVEYALSTRNGKPSTACAGRAAADRKVLIVEDDGKIADALALRIRSAGYHAITANDAVTGMNTAMREQPDLVLLDITMPGGDGFEIAQKMSTLLPKCPPMIFLTASKRPELRQKARELGATAFFEKPYEAADVLSAVGAALRGPLTSGVNHGPFLALQTQSMAPA